MNLKKKYLFIFGIGIIIILCGVITTMLLSKEISPDNIVISKIAVGETDITVQGSLTDSARGYKGYEVSYQNKKLFFKIKGDRFILGEKNGRFNITIDKDKYSEFDEIYLKNGSKIRKIWPE